MNRHFYIPKQGEETLSPLRKLILTGVSLLMFLAFSTTTYAQECTTTDDCVDFTFVSKTDNGNGTTTLCFELTVNCNKALSNAAFGVNGNAVSPSDNGHYTGPSGVSYGIENPTNNPFPGALKFETIGEGVKNGASETFCFDLPTSVADATTSIQIQAKAGNRRYTVTLDFSDCDNPPVVCDNVPSWGGGAAGVNGNDVNYPASNTTVCAGAPFVIENVVAPSGGSGALEVAWIKCSDPSGPCGSVFEELAPFNVGQIWDNFQANGGSPQIGNTCWEFAVDGDGDDLSLNVSGINSTTCFVRCVRREGCEPFTGEGNIITVAVENCVSPLTVDNTAENLNVYPNPATDNLYINISDYVGKDISIVIYDALGSPVYNQLIRALNYELHEVSLKEISTGFYTVVIRSKDQRVLSSRRFIKSN